jgi:cyclophilin family peptidyl-prolyl cis-trans isomerase
LWWSQPIGASEQKSSRSIVAGEESNTLGTNLRECTAAEHAGSSAIVAAKMQGRSDASHPPQRARRTAFFAAAKGPDSAVRGANGAAMTTYEKPSGDELSALAAEAKNLHARIRTAKGDIVFAFYPDEAPQHAAAFVKLARAGFYDGLTFHRVEPGFVIQGGDPSGNGTGGPGYQIDAEFSNLRHIKGTVAMARSANPNSAGSQFYICLDDASSLNKQYTVFGQTVAGQDVVDKIRKGDVMETVTIEPAA